MPRIERPPDRRARGRERARRAGASMSPGARPVCQLSWFIVKRASERARAHSNRAAAAGSEQLAPASSLAGG